MSKTTRVEKLRRLVGTQLTVNANRLERRMRHLDDSDVLSLYEEGSNMFFYGENLDRRTVGAALLNAAVHTLQDRYEAIRDLDLMQPFPLRNWMAGIPAN